MEFVTKCEVFHGGKLRKEGETVLSGEKLDTIYPRLFVRKGGRAEAKLAKPVNAVVETPTVKVETPTANNGNE